MTPRAQQLHDKAEAERRRCRTWLVERMKEGKPKVLTKAEYCFVAMKELGVSKSSFNAAWVWAIEETGRHDWYHGHALSIRRRGPRTVEH